MRPRQSVSGTVVGNDRNFRNPFPLVPMVPGPSPVVRSQAFPCTILAPAIVRSRMFVFQVTKPVPQAAHRSSLFTRFVQTSVSIVVTKITVMRVQNLECSALVSKTST